MAAPESAIKTCAALSQSTSQTSTALPTKDYVPAIVIGVAVIGVVLAFLWRKYKKETTELHNKEENLKVELLSVEDRMQQYRSNWEIEEHEIEIFDQIGKGAFGEVCMPRTSPVPHCPSCSILAGRSGREGSFLSRLASLSRLVYIINVRIAML